MANETIKYKSFSIIGAARSGVAAAKLLKSKGYKVLLSDINPEEKINKDFLKEIKQNNIPFEFGNHSEKVFENDLIVVSPGVPQSSPVLKKSFELGKEVVSEVELASWFCKGKIISILQANCRKRENLHPAGGSHGLLVDFLGRNKQRNFAAALFQFPGDGETRKEMPARAAARDGDEGRFGSGPGHVGRAEGSSSVSIAAPGILSRAGA